MTPCLYNTRKDLGNTQEGNSQTDLYSLWQWHHVYIYIYIWLLLLSFLFLECSNSWRWFHIMRNVLKIISDTQLLSCTVGNLTFLFSRYFDWHKAFFSYHFYCYSQLCAEFTVHLRIGIEKVKSIMIMPNRWQITKTCNYNLGKGWSYWKRFIRVRKRFITHFPIITHGFVFSFCKNL